MTTTATFAPDQATTRQVDFAADLLEKRSVPEQYDRNVLVEMIRGVRSGQYPWTKRQASMFIDTAKAWPRAGTAAAVAVEPGVYSKDGVVYRAYLGQQSGKVLCKRADEHGGLTYVGQADKHLQGAKRLTLEEAKAWGRTTGHCCACGRRLDVPESVDAGIGPVCAGRV